MLAAIGNKLIKVGTKIGLYPSCCCGDNCCPFSFDNVPFTLNTTCNGEGFGFSGTLFNGFGSAISEGGQPPYFGATANISVVCTASIVCPALEPLWGGYFVTVTVETASGGCSLYGKIVIRENPNDFTGEFCENVEPGSASIELIHCFFPPNNGSLTIG